MHGKYVAWLTGFPVAFNSCERPQASQYFFSEINNFEETRMLKGSVFQLQVKLLRVDSMYKNLPGSPPILLIEGFWLSTELTQTERYFLKKPTLRKCNGTKKSWLLLPILKHPKNYLERKNLEVRWKLRKSFCLSVWCPHW